MDCSNSKKQFDYISRYNDNADYGVIRGNNKIVFIKPGADGSYLGYEKKYLRIAARLHEKTGCSVISVSNLSDMQNRTESDRQIIEQYIADNKINKAELLFFGHSNGCIKGLELTASGLFFRRMILINMPLMINLHKTKKYIAEIQRTDIVAVYGEKDPSFSYTPFIDGKFTNVKVLPISNADHHFKNCLDDFISLSDMLIEE